MQQNRRSAIRRRSRGAITTSTQFELRLEGAGVPDGEIDADSLLAIVHSLKEIATKIGRLETAAEPVGRPPRRVERVARLLIGLASGSTCILVRRAGAGEHALDFDLADEQAFDDRFADLVDAIGRDERPGWVDDSLALAAADLTVALLSAARTVEFSVEGQLRRTFETAAIRKDTWLVTHPRGAEATTFVGRLYAANLNTHHLRVQDDVGNQVALPQVRQDTEVARLLGAHVLVAGTPEHDGQGRLTHIHEATIAAAPDPFGGAAPVEVGSLEEILASAPGPDPDGGIDLTDEEFSAFLKAARG